MSPSMASVDDEDEDGVVVVSTPISGDPPPFNEEIDSDYATTSPAKSVSTESPNSTSSEHSQQQILIEEIDEEQREKDLLIEKALEIRELIVGEMGLDYLGSEVKRLDEREKKEIISDEGFYTEDSPKSSNNNVNKTDESQRMLRQAKNRELRFRELAIRSRAREKRKQRERELQEQKMKEEREKEAIKAAKEKLKQRYLRNRRKSLNLKKKDEAKRNYGNNMIEKDEALNDAEIDRLGIIRIDQVFARNEDDDDDDEVKEFLKETFEEAARAGNKDEGEVDIGVEYEDDFEDELLPIPEASREVDESYANNLSDVKGHEIFIVEDLVDDVADSPEKQPLDDEDDVASNFHVAPANTPLALEVGQSRRESAGVWADFHFNKSPESDAEDSSAKEFEVNEAETAAAEEGRGNKEDSSKSENEELEVSQRDESLMNVNEANSPPSQEQDLQTVDEKKVEVVRKMPLERKASVRKQLVLFAQSLKQKRMEESNSQVPEVKVDEIANVKVESEEEEAFETPEAESNEEQDEESNAKEGINFVERFKNVVSRLTKKDAEESEEESDIIMYEADAAGTLNSSDAEEENAIESVQETEMNEEESKQPSAKGGNKFVERVKNAVNRFAKKDEVNKDEYELPEVKIEEIANEPLHDNDLTEENKAESNARGGGNTFVERVKTIAGRFGRKENDDEKDERKDEGKQQEEVRDQRDEASHAPSVPPPVFVKEKLLLRAEQVKERFDVNNEPEFKKQEEKMEEGGGGSTVGRVKAAATAINALQEFERAKSSLLEQPPQNIKRRSDATATPTLPDINAVPVNVAQSVKRKPNVAKKSEEIQTDPLMMTTPQVRDFTSQTRQEFRKIVEDVFAKRLEERKLRSSARLIDREESGSSDDDDDDDGGSPERLVYLDEVEGDRSREDESGWERQSSHRYSLWSQEEQWEEARRRICANLKDNLEDIKMNRKIPFFFRDSTTAYYGLVHSAIFGSEEIQSAEAARILGINNETIDQLKKYENERMEIERKISKSVSESRIDRLGRKISGEKSGGVVDRVDVEALHAQPHPTGLSQGRIGIAAKSEESIARPRTPQPRVKQLREQFRLFAKFGDRRNDGNQITLSRCDKWLSQAGVIDGRVLTTADTAIAFRKMSKSHIWMNFREWQRFLKELSQRKQLDLKMMQNALVSCGPPDFAKATLMDESILLHRLTDVNLYGGTHRNRFAGRKNDVDFLPTQWTHFLKSPESTPATNQRSKQKMKKMNE